jgi:hypothetical protein
MGSSNSERAQSSAAGSTDGGSATASQSAIVLPSVLDPGGPEAAGIEDAALVCLDPGLVVLLEDRAPRGELIHRLVEVIDEPARERRRGLESETGAGAPASPIAGTTVSSPDGFTTR